VAEVAKIVERFGVTCPLLKMSQAIEVPYEMILTMADAVIHERGKRRAAEVFRELRDNPQRYRVHREFRDAKELALSIDEYGRAWREGGVSSEPAPR
jgi:hypothetical protein